MELIPAIPNALANTGAATAEIIPPRFSGVDWRIASRAAALSEAIYDPTPLWPGTLKQIALIAAGCDRAAVLEDDDEIWVVFQGTHNLPSILSDFDIGRRRITSDGAEVHAGFDSGLDGLLPGIFSAIRRVLHPDKTLYITGHSRGASQAILTAYRLLLFPHACPFGGVYAIAPARPGNAKFSDSYNDVLGDKTFCFQHGADIVPWEPPYILGNRGVGHRVWFPCPDPGCELNKPVLDPPLYAMLANCALLTWEGWRSRPPQIEQLRDHHISTYVRLMSP